ncbi:helix-turn-helix domain-containing protein [Actinokineospora pegani]|uniref:helix-turn-helix domain-containing protein n=1 Tax=Actinokineospora pegani TaxID=2654637 RepID=UPI001F4583F8|nr:helix-turn-helix domain-containing protein [Actinokineospora pegani]
MSDIGRGIRGIRHARGKSLAVVAGLAGISEGHLSKLERGQRALDRRSLIIALANALEVSPAELADEAASGPDPDGSEAAVDDVRRALLAVGVGAAGGQVLPVDVLAERVDGVLTAQQRCGHEVVGAGLPALIRDAHATEAAGRDTRRVRRLLALLHVQGTQAWLRDVGSPLDLGWQAAVLAQRAADTLDDPVTAQVAAFGVAHGLLAAGALDLAAGALAAAPRPTRTPVEVQATGMLVFTDSLLAAATRTGDGHAALDEAADLAARVGEGNALHFGFGVSNVAVWRMAVALELGDHAAAARLSDTVSPNAIPSPQRRAAYWADRGRALTRVRGRRADAVRALREAERISPARVHRHPFTRAVLAELVTKAPNDAVGRELRGMAHRAGLR